MNDLDAFGLDDDLADDLTDRDACAVDGGIAFDGAPGRTPKYLPIY